MEIYSFWDFPGSVVNYKLLRVNYKSMESMEIIFHSVCSGLAEIRKYDCDSEKPNALGAKHIIA